MDQTIRLLQALDKTREEMTTNHLAQITGIDENLVDYFMTHAADMGRVAKRREPGHRRNAPTNYYTLIGEGRRYLARKLEEAEE